MRYSKKVAKPSYSALETIFDQRFDKLEQTGNYSNYQTVIKLKLDLKFEMNYDFNAELKLTKASLITKIEIQLNTTKLIVASALLFALITTVGYLVRPHIFSLLIGVLAGLFLYFYSSYQIQKELDKYVKDLIS